MSREENLQKLNMHKHSSSVTIGGREITFETGYMAKQAAGSVIVSCEETMVMSNATDGDPRPGLDFFPLMVDYREKQYASGRIPGNFFRREARPADHETLVSRLTDRPLRPLFPEGYFRDTNISSWVISYDGENEPDVLSMCGASAALCVSPIPFQGPIGAVRIGLIDGELIVNPTLAQKGESDLDLVVAGTVDAITMVEAGADEVSEEKMVEALLLAHDNIKQICAAISELQEKVGVAKMEHIEPDTNPYIKTILDTYSKKIETSLLVREKFARGASVKACRDEIVAELAGDDEDKASDIKAAFGDAKDTVFRELILNETRVDGRDTKTVRPIVIDLDLLPRAHGSALFTRGETQGLLVTTLGTGEDEQMIDNLNGKKFDRFLLHYNFPGFSVGECGGRPGPGRREIGHGALARRALEAVLPAAEEFPYTIRLVSDILESNGSSSMATVCGGSMSMMAAGVPLTKPVAGIAMGLVKEDNRYAILTDILGDEDHYGDMDFKVCGTENGITALQMDIKIKGLKAELLEEALAQAKDGRLHILNCMNEAISESREELHRHAPQITQVQIDPEFIAKVIGKGGETIRRIQDETGANLTIDDDGIITIASPNQDSIEAAKGWISDLTELPEEGKAYKGKITSVAEFGAFCEFIPGTEGLIHISEWDYARVEKMEDVAKSGDSLEVKLLEIDKRTGRFRLSRRALMEKPEGWEEPVRESRPPRREGGRGGRGGPRKPRDGDRRPPRNSAPQE